MEAGAGVGAEAQGERRAAGAESGASGDGEDGSSFVSLTVRC